MNENLWRRIQYCTTDLVSVDIARWGQGEEREEQQQ
jgi:hypothetical protein